MEHNAYIYILVMAAVTYLIRVLPLTLIRKEITNDSLPGAMKMRSQRKRSKIRLRKAGSVP